MTCLSFALPLALPSPNALMRMHYRVRGRYCRMLAQLIAVDLIGKRPREPIARARVQVWRHSVQPLDADSLAASTKLLLDCLQPVSTRHPHGLGIIADDRADVCDLTVRWVKAPHRSDVRTVVCVTELGRELRHDVIGHSACDQ